MKFTIQREAILKPLQFIIGVVERRQTLPVLSNVLMNVQSNQLSMTATDLEIEIVATTEMDVAETGITTLPARKLLDICKALPDDAQIQLSLDSEKNRVLIRSGKSRFHLATLPADDFPNVDEIKKNFEFSLPQSQIKHLIDKTQFAMAQQDVRYYLNGLLLEITEGSVKTVATDGHRLALCECDADVSPSEKLQVILPRKGVIELAKLMEDSDEPANISIGSNHLQVTIPGIKFTSKLIDGRFPDYTRVIPKGCDKEVSAEKDSLRQALARTSILSNEKYRGVRIRLSDSLLQSMAHNPEMEEAEEEVEVNYKGDELEIGFNVNYILDALSAIPTNTVMMKFGDANSSCLMTPAVEKSEAQSKTLSECQYVIMPMRL